VLCSDYAKEQEQFLGEIFGEIEFFQFNFADFRGNRCFWVNNGGSPVYMENLGKRDKKKTSKNEHKFA